MSQVCSNSTKFENEETTFVEHIVPSNTNYLKYVTRHRIHRMLKIDVKIRKYYYSNSSLLSAPRIQVSKVSYEGSVSAPCQGTPAAIGKYR